MALGWRGTGEERTVSLSVLSKKSLPSLCAALFKRDEAGAPIYAAGACLMGGHHEVRRGGGGGMRPERLLKGWRHWPHDVMGTRKE